MFLSDVSIKRPYFAFMINLAIIIFGVIAFFNLPISNTPNIDVPYVWVQIEYPGASPSTEEHLVLQPLEEALKGISGVKNIQGTANSGYAEVYIEFELEVPGDKALNDVRNVVSSIRFPEQTLKPQIEKIQVDSSPILNLAVTSLEGIPVQELTYIVKNTIQPQLQQVRGVSSVRVYADRNKEVHIELKQNILNVMGISPLFISQTVSQGIINQPVGQFRQPGNISSITAYKIPENLDSVAKIPLQLNNGKVVRIEDVAEVKNALTNETSYVELSGKPYLSMSVFKDSQGNTVQIAKDIKAKINKINSEYKDKIKLDIVYDNSTFISASVKGVEFDLFCGVILALLAVYLFLHEWKNTLICGIAIPTSLIGTLALMKYLNFSLNFMTLLALTLCIGIVIDDAIVVVENIHRHRTFGKSPLKAAFDGTSEIGFAALSVTLTIISVFVPVAFMQGMIGRYFYEFGMTVVVAVLISLFVAFTVVPMFSSKHKEMNSSKTKAKFFILFDEYFDRFKIFYSNFIVRILKYKKTTLTFAVVVFIISIILLKFVPMTFTIQEDNAQVNLNFQLAQNTSLDIGKERGKIMAKYVKKLPGVKDVLLSVYGNKIEFTVFLVSKENRSFSKTQFLTFLTEGLSQFIQDPKEKVGFSWENYPIQMSLISSKSEVLKDYGNKLAQFMNTLPEVKGATTSNEDPVYELRVTPNDTLSSLVNVNSQDLASTLQLFFDGIKVGKFNDNGQFIDIKMLLPNDKNRSLSDLSSTLIPSQNNSLVLLSSIAKIEKLPMDSAIHHLNGERVLTVKASYLGKDLNGVVSKIESYMNKTMPIELSRKLDGDSEMLQTMVSTVGFALLFGVLFVFMVLCVQFENLIAPLAILLSIPFSFSGAFIALLVTKNPLSIYSMIGIIMLMGLVTKNAILLVEFAQQKLKEGISLEESIHEAALVRLRPILMTTFTMIIGMLPMALSSGEGSEVRANIAVTVIGGLVSSTILTLLIVPCAYLTLVNFSESFSHKVSHIKFNKKFLRFKK